MITKLCRTGVLADQPNPMPIADPRIVNNVKTEPQMKIVRDNKTTINYSYKDKAGGLLFMISVKPQQYE